METKKQTVKLREKTLKDGTKSLYLDIWHNGKRKYKFLKLYIVPTKTTRDRDNNKTNLVLAKGIRAYDYDTGADDYMGGVIFTPYSSTGGFPKIIAIDGGGAVAFQLHVSYSY